jgi:hypothetical protein
LLLEGGGDDADRELRRPRARLAPHRRVFADVAVPPEDDKTVSLALARVPTWARLGSNQRPPACERCADGARRGLEGTVEPFSGRSERADSRRSPATHRNSPIGDSLTPLPRKCDAQRGPGRAHQAASESSSSLRPDRQRTTDTRWPTWRPLASSSKAPKKVVVRRSRAAASGSNPLSSRQRSAISDAA